MASSQIHFTSQQTNPKMKYILVTGGVISGIGKGILASSFGTILKGCGLRVTSIKIDPYLNIDAGTFSPYEHGEVYVLEDGSEVDLDLGNYERFLDTTLRGDNNITTGKIYQQVIRRERKGAYLGKTVQVIPHITDCIREHVLKVANTPRSEDNQIPDVCIIELGGVIGDIESMPFVEAFRQLRNTLKKEDFCLAHVSLVPELPLGPTAKNGKCEQKSKPTQTSVRELRSLGLIPDLVFCRSRTPLNDAVKKKISDNCHVKLDEVISVFEVSNIYEVPILLQNQGVVGLFADILRLDISDTKMNSSFTKWKEMAVKADKLTEEVNIVIVGKYTKLEDAYASISRSLQHAALAAGFKLKLGYVDADYLGNVYKSADPTATIEALATLAKSDGVVVAGGFGKRGVEGKIEACRWCRQYQKPLLGICLGLQVAVIEFARNVLDLKNADSSEFWTPEEQKCSSSDEETALSKSGNGDGDTFATKSSDRNECAAPPSEDNFVIIDMPEHTKGDKGGTMRLGLRKTFFRADHKAQSQLYQLYGRKDVIEERHRHRYEVNPKYTKRFEEKGLLFVGVDEEENRMELMELHDGKHPYYVATQYHPEYTSRPLAPSPPFYGLILAAKGKLKSHLNACK